MLRKIPVIVLFSLFFLITVLVLSLSLGFIYNLLFLKDEGDSLGRLGFLTVIGESMLPEFNPGDVIVIKETQKNDIKPGDIVTFTKDEVVITHRVSKVENGKFFTRGDNNAFQDNYSIDFNNIIGKYILKIPYGTNLLNIIKSPILATIIFIILLVNITLLFKVILGKNIIQRF